MTASGASVESDPSDGSLQTRAERPSGSAQKLGHQDQDIRRKLGMPVRDVLRADEPLAQALKLAERNLSDDELISLMAENPDLLQRPIVVRGNEAVLCRPPQEVMKLL